MLIKPDVKSQVTRRSFLQAVGRASARGLRSVASSFTSIESQIGLWFYRCLFSGGLRYAGAG